jgi:hypothetical protein
MHFAIDACPHHAWGTRVIVTAIHPGFDDPKTNAFAKEIPFVDVRSEDGRWTGTTQNIGLMPIIPVGTRLTLKSDNSPATIYPHISGDRIGSDFSIGSPVDVVVLGQHIPSENCDLRVRVLTGPKAGRDGWTCDTPWIPGTKLSAHWLN